MSNTVFSNPHGLDDHEEHYSTAYDMAILTRYAMKNKAYQEIAGTKIHKFQRGEFRQSWGNKNRLLTEKYKYCTGGKTGFTKRAGRTLVTTATKNDLDLIAVTINAGDDWNDHISMYENAFNQYTLQTILDSGTLNINANGIEKKELFTKNPILFPLTEKEEKYIKMEYKLLHPKDLEKKQEGSVGFAILLYQQDPVQKVPIYIRETDEKEKRDWWQQLLDKLFSKMGMTRND